MVDAKNKNEIDAVQGALKVLVNSFFGVLGSNVSPFAFKKGAETVTQKGRETISMMIEALKEHGFGIITYDTDGIILK